MAIGSSKPTKSCCYLFSCKPQSIFRKVESGFPVRKCDNARIKSPLGFHGNLKGSNVLPVLRGGRGRAGLMLYVSIFVELLRSRPALAVWIAALVQASLWFLVP